MRIRDQAVAQRYARALFEAARARGAEVEVGADLEAILSLEEPKLSLRLFLEAPNVRDDVKRRVVDETLGGRVHALTLRFVHLLLAKRRAYIGRQVTAAYLEILREHQGRVKARVVSATPLADDLRESLRVAIERRTGKKVEIHALVDAAVLGGISVQWGDQILDDTVRTRLSQIRERLLEVEV